MISDKEKDKLFAQGLLTGAVITGLIVFIFSVAGCGINVHPDELKVAPIEVVHEFGLSQTALENFFEKECQADPDPAECKAQKLEEFGKAFVAGVLGQ